MAKSSANDLNFGHLGQTTYSLENSEWRFSRIPGRRNELTLLGSWKTVLTRTIQLDKAATTEYTQKIRSTQQAAKALGRSNPEIVPSIGLIPEFAIVSAAITSTAGVYDPAIGPLLSFGSFTFEGRYDHPRRVAALPTGEAGNILRLVALTKERHGWETDKSTWVEGPSITDEESGYWTEDAAPIQQLCFAQGENRSAFLAVRFPTRVVLFRPIHRARRTPPQRSPNYELPFSKFDAHPILEIPIEQTGASPHAHVTFNPDYQRQVGVVDQKGNWTIWDIEGGYKGRKQYSVSCTAQGTMTLRETGYEEELEEKEALFREDGWARILWIGDVNTILVCNRRTVGLFDIRGGQKTLLKCSELIPELSADWILDVKRHARNKHQFFVLTSTRLFLLAVTCLNDGPEDGNSDTGASVLLAWTHFQGLEDITLQLCVPTVSDEDSIVLIHSHLNNLITVFRFQADDPGHSLVHSNSDPMILNLDDGLSTSTKGSRHITHLHLDQLQFGQDDRHEGTGPGLTYLSRNVHFYRLSAILSDLSVHQVLLYSHEFDKDNTVRTQLIVEPPTWSTVTRPRHGLYPADSTGLDDDFIVPEGMGASSVPTLTRPYRPPKLLKRQSPASSQSVGVSVGPGIIDYGFIYDALVKAEALPTNDETITSEVDEVLAVVDRAKRLLIEEANHEDVPRGTMMEFAESKIKVVDIDGASSSLEDLLSREVHDNPLRLQRIASGKIFYLKNEDDLELTISSLYDMILHNWIAPLPTNIPLRIRQIKERLARRIAAEVMLASMRIRYLSPTQSSEAPLEPLGGSSQYSGVSLPILPSRKGNQGLDGAVLSAPLQPPKSSQPSLPSRNQFEPVLPIPKTGPSSTTSTPFFTPVSDPFARLSQHLKINKPAPKVPSGVSQVLMHWQLGADPRTYDWDVTTRRVDEELHGDEDMDASRQEKTRRKAERMLKRQRREEELMRGKAESQPQFPRSSPGPMLGGMGMSSQVQSQTQSQSQPFVVQSQIEQGRHGGRPMKKKKKVKSRLSGF